MKFLIILIIGYLVFRYLVPVIGRYMVRRMVRRQFESFFGSMNQGGGTSGGGATGSRQQRKEKKFSRNDGEYVEYEEITVTETTTTGPEATETRTTVDYVSEQQITDADWEEIK